jgi:hypothetical protein
MTEMLDNLADELEALSPDELEDRLQQYAEQYDLDSGEHANPADLEGLFVYFQTLLYAGHYGEATQLLARMKPFLDQAVAAATGPAADEAAPAATATEDAASANEAGAGTAGPATESEALPLLLEFLVEWNHLAVRFVGLDLDHYPEYPYFREIMDHTQGRGGRLEVRYWQAALGQINHYLDWLRRGGDPNTLPLEQREELNALYERLTSDVQAVLERLRAEERYAHIVPLRRTFARFLLQTENYGMALTQSEALLADLPQHPEYHPADLAEARMEYGQQLLHFGQVQNAREQFRAAWEAFSELGEAYEIHAAQAEGWLQEVEAG